MKDLKNRAAAHAYHPFHEELAKECSLIAFPGKERFWEKLGLFF